MMDVVEENTIKSSNSTHFINNKPIVISLSVAIVVIIALVGFAYKYGVNETLKSEQIRNIIETQIQFKNQHTETIKLIEKYLTQLNQSNKKTLIFEQNQKYLIEKLAEIEIDVKNLKKYYYNKTD